MEALVDEMTRSERVLWAGLSAIVGMAHEGTDLHAIEIIEAACETFRVRDDVDQLARRFGLFFYPPWDAYLDRDTFYEVGLREGYSGWMPAAPGVH